MKKHDLELAYYQTGEFQDVKVLGSYDLFVDEDTEEYYEKKIDDFCGRVFNAYESLLANGLEEDLK